MKKLLFLLLSIVVFSGLFGNTVTESNPVLNANQIFIPIDNFGQKISLMELSKISMRDFEVLTNRKMKFFERLAFKSGQKKLRKGIETDGTIRSNRLKKNLIDLQENGVDSFEGGDKSQVAAALLCFFLGSLGIHRFYLGYTWQGIVQLLTLGGLGIWALIDFVRILTGDLKPKNGEYAKKM